MIFAYGVFNQSVSMLECVLYTVAIFKQHALRILHKYIPFYRNQDRRVMLSQVRLQHPTDINNCKTNSTRNRLGILHSYNLLMKELAFFADCDGLCVSVSGSIVCSFWSKSWRICLVVCIRPRSIRSQHMGGASVLLQSHLPWGRTSFSV